MTDNFYLFIFLDNNEAFWYNLNVIKLLNKLGL